MAGSVKSTGGFLTRAATLTLTGDVTCIIAVKFGDSPANGVYRTGVSLHNGTTGLWVYYQFPPDDTNAAIAEYHTGASQPGTTHDDSLGSNASLTGKWIHLAFTRRASDGNQNVYALTEGFNPASPSFLISPSVGTLTTENANTIDVWRDNATDGDVGNGLSIAHVIICQGELTQAQVLQQFQQRGPTDAVKAFSYTYLACKDETAPEVDLGSTATNFTKSSTFAADATYPLEWGFIAWQRDFSDNPPIAVSRHAALAASSGSFSPVTVPVVAIAPTVGYTGPPDVVRPVERRPHGGEFAPKALAQFPMTPLAWSARFPDSAPGSRPLVAEGFSVGEPFLPALTTLPPLAWTSRFADVVPRARILPIGGSGFLPVIPPPTEVDWSEFAPTDETFDTEVVLQTWAQFSLRNAFARVIGGHVVTQPPVTSTAVPTVSLASFPDMVYGRKPIVNEGWSVSETYISNLAVPALSWSSFFPDFARIRQPIVNEGWSVSEPYISNLAVPALSFQSFFPDFARTRKPTVNEGWSVSEPYLSSLAVPTLSWSAFFSDFARTRQPLVSEGLSVSEPYLPSFPVLPSSWSATMPDIVRGAQRPVGEGWSVSEPFLPTFPVPALSWSAFFSDFARAPKLPVGTGLSVSNVLPITNQAAVPGWANVFPDKIFTLPRLVGEGMSVSEPWLSALPVPALSWTSRFSDIVPTSAKPVVGTGLSVSNVFPIPNQAAIPGWAAAFPDKIFTLPRLVGEGWSVSEPYISNLAIPALSFQSFFPDFARTRNPLVSEGWSVSEPYLSVLPATPLSWQPFFADFAPTRRPLVNEGWSVSEPFLPTFPVPALSWYAFFPDRVPGPRRPVQEGLSVANILPIAGVPNLSWASFFPDRVPGYSRPVQEGQSVINVLPIAGVPTVSWAAFPDRVPGPRRPVGEGWSVSEPYLSALVPPTLSWTPRFPDSIAAAPRDADLSFYTRSPEPVVIIPAPDLSWQAWYADIVPRELYVVQPGLWIVNPASIIPPPPAPPGPDLSLIAINQIEVGTVVQVSLPAMKRLSPIDGLFRVLPGGDRHSLNLTAWRRLVGTPRRSMIGRVIGNDPAGQEITVSIEDSTALKSDRQHYTVIFPYKSFIRMTRLVPQARPASQEAKQRAKQPVTSPTRQFFHPLDRFISVELVTYGVTDMTISFTWQVPTTSTTWTVPLPSDSVFTDQGYNVVATFNTLLGAPAHLNAPDANRTSANFVLNATSTLQAGTTIDFFVKTK